MFGRWICYVLASALSLATMAILLVEGLFLLHIRPTLEKYRAVEVSYLEPFTNDQQFLATLSLIPLERFGKTDAGPFLNSRVHWTPKPIFRTHGSPNPLVPIATRETLIRMRDEWMKKHKRAKNMNADLSIFSELSRFDFWDIETDSPIGDLAERKIFVPPSQLPTPEVLDLISVVKIRLMLGAYNGKTDFIHALSDVHNLAKLLLTTENQSLIITGLAALDAERFAYHYFVDEMQMPENLWSPTDHNLLRRTSRAVLGTRGFLHLWTDPDILDRIYLKGQLPTGFCAAVNESLPIEMSLRPRLEPQWPLEIKLRAEYAMLDMIYRRAHSACRIRYLGELMSHDAIRVSTPGPLILNRLPYARKVFGLRTSVLNFRGFNEYANSASP